MPNLVEKIVSNPALCAILDRLRIPGALAGCLDQEPRFTKKRCRGPINRNRAATISEHTILRWWVNLGSAFTICAPGTGINQYKFSVRKETPTLRVEKHLVLPTLTVQFPRRLEQFKKFADNLVIRCISDYAYHAGPLAPCSYRSLLGAEPLFKEDQAEEDLVIILSTGGVLVE